MAVTLSKVLEREKEVFDAYIANSGREVALQPLIRKYSQEDLPDGQVYPFIKVFDYLKLYVSSNIITPEELEKFNEASEVDYNKKVARGKEIVELLIENRCRWSEVSILSKKYAIEDGKFRSYSSDTLKEWRRLFLSQNTDVELEKMYRTVVELSRNRETSGYDLMLLDKVTEYKSIEEAAKFIAAINISYKSITTLLNAYKTVYPNKNEEFAFITKVIAEAFKEETNNKKFIPTASDSAKKVQKIINFKNILEDYLTADVEKIESLFAKHHFTKYSFEEIYKDMEGTTDPILKMLINQYEAKLIAIGEVRREEVEQILRGLVNGISYGGAYRRFNYYDLKQITDMSLDDILKYAHKFFTRREYEMIKNFIQTRLISRTYRTREELFESVNYGKNGRMVTDEEKWDVITFMEANNWPYSTQLMIDTLSRYMDNDVVFFENNEITEEIEIKMNK